MSAPFQTTSDAFLNGRIVVSQPEKGFRSGLDAVLLAAACPAAAQDTVLEAGCGAGVASLCLLARVPDISVTAVELDPELCKLAAANAARNGFAGRFHVAEGDVTETWQALERAGIRKDAYDHVMANPPFFDDSRGRRSPHDRKAQAKSMAQGRIEAWIRFLTSAAGSGGTAAVIDRAGNLPALLQAFENRFGALQILPIHPLADRPAIRFVIRGIKGSRAPVSFLPGIVLHDHDGSPTAFARTILKDAGRLF